MGKEERRATDTPRTDGLLRRIDYLRQTAGVSSTGLNAPPGENPYAEDFGVLSYPETMRLLEKHAQRAHGNLRALAYTITRTDIAKLAGLTDGPESKLGQADFIAFCKGNQNALGRKRRRQLSRVLLMLESGQLVKRDGKMVYLQPHEVPPTAPMHRFRVCIDGEGRVTIARGEPLAAPKQMPRLFADFRLPGEK